MPIYFSSNTNFKIQYIPKYIKIRQNDGFHNFIFRYSLFKNLIASDR